MARSTVVLVERSTSPCEEPVGSVNSQVRCEKLTATNILSVVPSSVRASRW